MTKNKQTQKMFDKLMLLQNENKYFKQENRSLKVKNQTLQTNIKKTTVVYKEIGELRKRERAVFLGMLSILQGNIPFTIIENDLMEKIGTNHLLKLYTCVLVEPRHIRKKALIIIYCLYGIGIQMISEFLFVSKKAIKRQIKTFKQEGVDTYLDCSHYTIKISGDPSLQELLISIIHSPPCQYGINRTSWTIKLLKNVLAVKGYLVGKNSISMIIRKAGYKFWKAKEVLTSNDPNYKEKVEAITQILSKLRPNEKFFSIDEFGPFAVKERGGRRIVRNDEHPTVPQWQKSKGSLIITAALEFSTNQVTHFYSTKKDSSEMIKLLNILIETYSGNKAIYLSWDCASWHSSKILLKAIDEINKYRYRRKHNTPIVKLALLPAQAQFLNVIESVFSGMAAAIIEIAIISLLKRQWQRLTGILWNVMKIS